MKIWLTMKGLLTVIQMPRPEPTNTNPRTAEIEQWTKRDQIDRGAILSALSNTLFEIYCSDSYTSKSLWDELDRKYNTEDGQNFQILEKFWHDTQHQKWRLSLGDLMFAISIEEEHRNQTHKISVEHHPRANLILEKQKVNKAKLYPNKKAKTGQTAVNMVVGGSSGASTSGATEGYVSVQPELLTIYEPCDWLIDTRANVHVCADKSHFVSYQGITGRTVSMGNSSTAEVLGIGSVDLKFPSGHILSLKRVHHVPTVRRNIISGSKKLKPDGTVDKFKARLVAKGFKQKEGIYYFDAYSSVARLTTIRVLIELASVYSLPIHQMDVKTAFLYGEFEEKIYMDQPEGFVTHGNEHKDMGEDDVILGINLIRSTDGIAISQAHYVEKIIEKFGYQSTNSTRPDISFSISKLARYTSCPDRTHWDALDRVLKYLKGTVSLATHYGRFFVVLEGYSDASWIAKNSESNECSGYIFTLGGGAVS
ncbi:UNVERIFIED_CONTAM: Retrovirus-related Pol polyprotein from transposon TNT 1-94 [Sesamum latifolium]|uniref:Retrovirus-related Pol polyprotein from transposon TNT 1-94 n=1 Tax=Sesamum latifolium TaxID=2727402 RepID=A0AAW2UF66_9LAMI